MKTGKIPTLYVDATGVGQPVADVINGEDLGCRPIPVYFTHGDHHKDEYKKVTMGKAFWIRDYMFCCRADASIYRGRPKQKRWRKSCWILRFGWTRTRTTSMERLKCGTHDDLVTALGLAFQVDREHFSLALHMTGN